MAPFHPNQYPNQYPNTYPNGQPVYDQYSQQQYSVPSYGQPIPPYSRFQVNVPTQQDPHVPYLQHRFQYEQNPQIPQQPMLATHVNYQYESHNLQSQYLQQQQNQHILQPLQYYQHTANPAVHHAPAAQPQQRYPQPVLQNERVLQDTQPNTAQPQEPLKSPSPSKPKPQEPDFAILLLTLADEYMEAAEKLSVRSDDYFKLTATALGCIESALNNFKFQPLREAQVSLKYAQILYNETENNDDAERILTKTIEVCDRLKFWDLKYGAQLLLIKVLHRSRPKAALKDLQGMIQDVETYKHTAWEYALRLQYVIFVMSTDVSKDTHAALTQLERLSNVSKANGDNAVFALVSILEALVHLQTLNTESVASSQRALAEARALQLNTDVGESPQMTLMMEFVDLCGQIKDLNTITSEQKRKSMQQALYPALDKAAWRSDGLMYVPLDTRSLKGLSVQDGGLIIKREGRYFLTFSWLSKDEVEDLGYLLSGISAAYKNAGDNGKADKFLLEGVDMLKEILGSRKSVTNAASTVRIRQNILLCHFYIETALMRCSKGHYSEALGLMDKVREIQGKLGEHMPATLQLFFDFTDGVICQGQGDVDKALAIFQSPRLRLTAPTAQAVPVGRGAPRQTEFQQSMSLLATMNSVFILQSPSHPEHYKLPHLLHVLDPVIQQTQNKAIKATYDFVLASLPNNKILQTKQYLGKALNAAQAINNAQITTLCLVSMQEKFFKGVQGEQSIKCARAASHQAKRLNEPMWMSVAASLEAHCLDLHDQREEAAKKHQEAQMYIERLPANVNVNVAVAASTHSNQQGLEQ